MNEFGFDVFIWEGRRGGVLSVLRKEFIDFFIYYFILWNLFQIFDISYYVR